jgi:NAD(P)-dependent dehydrogenase (short-subunit alcohol dehydrogenase family)
MITGAAMGLGKATAQLLAREGAKVALTDVNEKEGAVAANDIASAGGEAIFLRHDVSREADWTDAIDHVVRRWGALSVLVNNAGLGIAGTAEDMTLEDWRRLMSVNLDGVFLGTKHAIRAMKRTGGGSIINLSSIEGLVGDPNLAAYNASKGGVRLFTKSAALHCARSKYNIRVNSIHPGYIWTPMVSTYLQGAGDVEAGRRELDKRHPLGHVGEPDDIAYGVLYLASEESKFMTGAELVIDGGYTAQ